MVTVVALPEGWFGLVPETEAVQALVLRVELWACTTGKFDAVARRAATKKSAPIRVVARHVSINRFNRLNQKLLL